MLISDHLSQMPSVDIPFCIFILKIKKLKMQKAKIGKTRKIK